jgi:hypothetical protein
VHRLLIGLVCIQEHAAGDTLHMQLQCRLVGLQLGHR